MLLKVGSEGPLVEELQRALGISADGIFGKGTEASVKQFQKDNNLTVDGLVGSSTWEAIGIDTDTIAEPTDSEYTTKDGFGSTLPIFMSKLDYLKIGGWDENYELGMVADWDFFLKANLNNIALIRLYNLHFYHFASASTNGNARQTAETNGHSYAKYKWGSYIQHDPVNNQKFI